VIGGGPAGLKAATVAARRGHRVTLLEKETRLGGQVVWAVRVAGRAEFGDIVRNLLHEVEQLGVEVKTGTTATMDSVLAAKPEAVIVATGSVPNRATIPGGDGPGVAGRGGYSVRQGPAGTKRADRGSAGLPRSHQRR
jgi:NADPH-dependent 2,4-dienoyl-CoA reductase/sulfur reductase-like enzyme